MILQKVESRKRWGKMMFDKENKHFQQRSFVQKRIRMNIGGEDIEVAYREWGDSDNHKKLFCVHGLTRNSKDFDFLAASMSNQYNVICIDIPGRGVSGYFAQLDNYNFQNYMTAIKRVISSITPGKIDFLGTSMGGVVAMSLASIDSSLIRKLVLNDVGPFVPGVLYAALNAHEKTKPKSYNSYAEAVQYHKEHCSSFGPMSDEQWGEFTMNGMREDKDGRFIYDYDKKLEVKIAQNASGELNVWDVWDQIKCPVLVIRGETSMALQKEVAEEMAQRGPKADLIEIPVTGHAPTLMSEEQVSIVRDWLDS